MQNKEFRHALTCKDQHILHASFVTLLELAKTQVANESCQTIIVREWGKNDENSN